MHPPSGTPGWATAAARGGPRAGRLVRGGVGDGRARMFRGGGVVDGQGVVVAVGPGGEGAGLALIARGEAWAPSAASAV